MKPGPSPADYDHGEAYSPLGARLVGHLNVEDIAGRESIARECRANKAVHKRLQNAATYTFHTGAGNGIRRIASARAEYFKRRDPWYY